MLAGLSHGAVGSGDNEDGAVHLSSAGDHVLDIVGVARAVDVGVVTALDVAVVRAGLVVVTLAVVGLILDVSGVDGDAALSLFRSLIDGRVIRVLERRPEGQILGDGSGQGGLAVVDMTDGANVHMGLGSFKFLLCHFEILLSFYQNNPCCVL
jgi:hypothetical protein